MEKLKFVKIKTQKHSYKYQVRINGCTVLHIFRRLTYLNIKIMMQSTFLTVIEHTFKNRLHLNKMDFYYELQKGMKRNFISLELFML